MFSVIDIEYFKLYEKAYEVCVLNPWSGHTDDIFAVPVSRGRYVYAVIEPEVKILQQVIPRRICIYRNEKELEAFNSNILEPTESQFHAYEHYCRSGCLTVQYMKYFGGLQYIGLDIDPDVERYWEWMHNSFSNEINASFPYLYTRLPYRGIRWMTNEEKDICFTVLASLHNYIALDIPMPPTCRIRNGVLPARILSIDSAGKLRQLKTGETAMPSGTLKDLQPLPLFDPDMQTAFQGKKKSGSWCIDLIVSPSPVRDAPGLSPDQITDDCRHIFPMCLVILDMTSQKVITFCAIKNAFTEAGRCFIGVLLSSAFSEADSLPKQIVVQDPQVRNLLREICSDLQIDLSLKTDAADPAIDDLIISRCFRNNLIFNADWSEKETVLEINERLGDSSGNR